MLGKIIRIAEVSFDARQAAFAARVTYAAPSGLVERALLVPGHRAWSAAQITRALLGRQ
ncbi:MAG: hypothetical protein AAF618_02115 [Pseudomonadota bacterium]